MRDMMFGVLLLLAVCLSLIAGSSVAAGEPAARPGETIPAPRPDDPFAGVLENSPMELRKIGPSCQFLKIPLPEGVRADEIPGIMDQ